MSGEIDRTVRFDARVSFDVGSYSAAVPGEALGGVSAYFTVLNPYGAHDNPMETRAGARIGVSGYFSGKHEFVDLTPEAENPAEGGESFAGEWIKGVRAFLGLELEVPVCDIVSLRFSPGAVLKYDNINDMDYGAAVVSELMIDLSKWATMMLHFTSDVYTRDRTEQFIGGIGFGFTL